MELSRLLKNPHLLLYGMGTAVWISMLPAHELLWFGHKPLQSACLFFNIVFAIIIIIKKCGLVLICGIFFVKKALQLGNPLNGSNSNIILLNSACKVNVTDFLTDVLIRHCY